MMYHKTRFGCKRITSSEDIMKRSYSDNMSSVTLTLNIAKQPFHIVAEDDASPDQVWLQKVKWFRRYHPNKYSKKYWAFTVTLTMSIAKPFFKKSVVKSQEASWTKFYVVNSFTCFFYWLFPFCPPTVSHLPESVAAWAPSVIAVCSDSLLIWFSNNDHKQ